ncbi:MAG TPA: hypothetical protein DDW50_15495, partial [Firmicutes bacterium]|nr:hypothetical protein [Bacillota bacterium]
LIHETSPYLLQHAHNPVDWFPWGEEAFQKARQEDKPILLSCGYSACHWCHVMERESFENPEIAHLMNEYFVNIKVDREERPDIDQLYQQAVQAITGQGGWPLTAFLDHEQRPFFGGTYFPPVSIYGRISFPQLLQGIHDKWQNQRGDIQEASRELGNFLKPGQEISDVHKTPERELPLKAGLELYKTAIDPENGGFGQAPKFPNPSFLQLFLRLGEKYQQPALREHAIFTLRKMAQGGIYDQLGGGFHRYSTDEKWLVPHFEKMLYDNAQLLKIYTIGYQLTHYEEFQDVVCQTADYIRREMTAPEGGFYATQDADSEGVEGKFFVWKLSEVQQVLGAEEAQLLAENYRISAKGNFEGANILNRLTKSTAPLKPSELDPGIRQKIKNAKERIFKAREARVKPFRDEKIITGWNGLMMGALAYAYQVLGREEDYQSAKRAGNFIWDSLRLPDGRLARIYKDGQAKVEAILDDYTFLSQAFLDLYEADFDEVWLKRSLELTAVAIKEFGKDGNGHYYTAAGTNNLFTRPLSGEDQAIPSGVSVHCENLLRLQAFTGRNDFYQEAEGIFRAYREMMAKGIWAYAGLIGALDMYYQGINGFTFISEDAALPEILKKLQRSYIPYRIVAWKNNLHQDAVHPAKELFQDRLSLEGKPTCYPCSAQRCFDPVTDWQALHQIVTVTMESE